MDKLISGQPVTTKTAYGIRRYQHIDAGFLKKMGTDVTTIESIVREAILNGDANVTAKSIVEIEVDLLLNWVDITYIDILDREGRKTLFLKEMEVCFAKKSETQ